MLDPVTLALPMIQTMSGLGAQGSFELTAATGLHIELSVGYGASATGAGDHPGATPSTHSFQRGPTPNPFTITASQQTLQAPHLGLPLGLPTLPAPDLSALHGLVSALEQTGQAFGTVVTAIGSATRQIVSAWTGPAAKAALEVVNDISAHSGDLEVKNSELATATNEAAAIVGKAATEIAAIIAKFLNEAAASLSLVETGFGPLIAIIGAALNSCRQAAEVFMTALGELQGPTAKALQTAHDARLNVDITLPLALPSLATMAEAAGAALTPKLPTVEGQVSIPGMVNIGGKLAPGSFPSGHIAWGEEANNFTQSHPAGTEAASSAPATNPPTTTNVHNYTGPSGAQQSAATTASPTVQPAGGPTASSTGTGVTYAPPSGGNTVAATSIGANNPANGANYSTGYNATHSSSTGGGYATTSTGYGTSANTSSSGYASNGYSSYGTRAAAGTSVAHTPAATTTGVGYVPDNGTGNGNYPATEAHTTVASYDSYSDLSYGGVDGPVPVVLPNGSTVYTPNPIAARAIESALSQIGVPYVWGGTSPGVGLDCSGLTQWAYEQAGLEIGRTTWDQDNNPQIPVGDALPGDLLIWDGHVAMFLGNGLMIEAGDPVSVTPVRTENAGMAFEGVFRPWLKAQ